MSIPSQTCLALIQSPDQLTQALKANPELINEQDENGSTLLHHIAQNGPNLSAEDASLILGILLECPELDFTLKNNRQNTALHEAAMHCGNRVVSQFIFPALVAAAAKKGFDFCTTTQENKTVLHLAAMAQPFEILNNINNIQPLLDTGAELNLNALSTGGSTALFYAINKARYLEADALINAGANPSLCGTPERAPFVLIQKQLRLLNDGLLNPAYAHAKNTFTYHVEELTKLQEKMTPFLKKQSRDEITKTTVVITQSLRDLSIFSRLPKHLHLEIAAETQTTLVYTKKEAVAIANECRERYLSKRFN